MSPGTRYWFWWSGEAILAAAIVLTVPTWQQPSVSRPLAALAGIAAAGALFALLARPRHGLVAVAYARRRLVGAKAAAVVLQASIEETLWRLLLLGAVAHIVGWPLGLLVSTVGFGLVHARGGPRAVLVHHVTGAAFGGVFLATGRFLAPVVAHGAYNALVVLANEHRFATWSGR